MRLYNDTLDRELLVPGTEVEFIMPYSGAVVGAVTEYVGGDMFRIKDSDDITWSVKSNFIELINEGTPSKLFWHYLKDFKGERIALKPRGYALNGESFELDKGEATGLDSTAAALLKRGLSKERVERLIAQYKEGAMGCNRREDFVPQPQGEEVMSERKPCPECGKELSWMADGSRPRVHKCELKAKPEAEEQEQQNNSEASQSISIGKPAGPTVDKVLAVYIETRDKIAEEKKIYEEKVAGLKAFQEKREQWLAAKMSELGVTNLKMAGVGIAFFKTKSSATLADAAQFTDWVLEDWEKRNHFLERRVSKTAVDELIEAGETQPPGVNFSTVRVVQVNRG